MEESTMTIQVKSTLGVGIVGVSPVRGWAATAHIPALRALPNYEIRGLSAHNAETARKAGEVFGVSAVFSDHEQLVAQPDIDLVAVTVKVPHHRELVSAALAAGKAVYCEWPLGRDLEEGRRWLRSLPSKACTRWSGCRRARPRQSSSSRSCSATDMSARSCRRQWSGSRFPATWWSRP